MFTKKRLLTAGLLLLIVGTVWLFRPDPHVARARALRQELFSAAGKQLSAEQRQQKWREFREVTKALTPAQRQQLSGDGRKEKQRAIAQYFKMPPREKVQFLDAQIRREQQMQQKMQARGGAQKGRGPGASGRSSSVGKRSEQERDQQRQKFLDRSSPAERAMMNQYRKDLNARRNQLRLPAPRGFGPPR
jgi:hypothetical protein